MAKLRQIVRRMREQRNWTTWQDNKTIGGKMKRRASVALSAGEPVASIDGRFYYL